MRRKIAAILLAFAATIAVGTSAALAEDTQQQDLAGVILPQGTEEMDVLNYSLCDKSIYDESFDDYFDGDVVTGLEELLNAEQVYVNGIAVPAEPEEFFLNGREAIWQLDSGNWTWKSHDVMWGDETGEGVQDYSEARKNFLNGLTQFRGMTVVLLAEPGEENADVVAVTVVNSGLAEGITDNGDGTLTLEGVEVTADAGQFDQTIQAGDIAIYWIGADGMHVEKAIDEEGIYHYEIGELYQEAFETDSINGEPYVDAQIARTIQDGSKPNQFARALKRLDIQDCSMTGWWTQTHYLIGCTRNTKTARETLGQAIEHAEAGTEGIAVSTDGSDVADGAYWVTEEVWNEFETVLDTAKSMLADENATGTQMDEIISELADVYGSETARGDHLTGPIGVMGAKQPGTMAACADAQEGTLEEEKQEASIVSASYVTEVLEWGETMTGVRIEYDDEINAEELSLNLYPSYVLVTEKSLHSLYVNNSGKLHDAEPYGKYVFIEFAVPEEDYQHYADYVSFNEIEKTREQLPQMYACQMYDITTRSGKTAPKSIFFIGGSEIREGIDDFVTADFTYENSDGNEIYMQYHTYIPEGYEALDDSKEALPLVVHFSHDNYVDYTGNYYGPLIAHNDGTVWVSEEAQEENPCFAVTLSGTERKPSITAYKYVVDELCSKYNIDTSRIYGVTYAGSSPTLWSFVLEYPNVLAAAITTSMTPDEINKEDLDDALGKFGTILDTLPTWNFVGYCDNTGTNQFGLGETKGMRMVTIGKLMQETGRMLDIGFGEEGELMWDGSLRGSGAEKQAEEQIQRAASEGADDMITVYLPNTIRFSDHWCWTSVYNNSAVREWLFEQVNDAPYNN